MFFKIPGCIFLSSSISPNVTTQLSILNGLRKNWSSLSPSKTDEEDRPSLTQLNFPLWEVSCQVLGTELLSLGVGLTQVIWNCSSYPLQCIKSLGFCFIHFFAPTLCWITITKILNFQKVTLIQEFLSILVSFWRKTVGNSYFDIFLMTLWTKKFREEQNKTLKN